MLEEGIFDMKRFAEGGWVTALKYEDEIIDDLKVRTAGDGEKEKEKVRQEHGVEGRGVMGEGGEFIDDLKARTAGDGEKEKAEVGEGVGGGMGVAVGTLSLQSRLHNE